MIERMIAKDIKAQVGKGQTIVIYGARQVGKTTMLHQIFDDSEGVLWLNGDDDDVREAFSRASLASLAPIVVGHKVVIIDEAQRIGDIGLKLKILHDNLGKEIQFVATGSSSFELANKINEPMTGRKRTYWLSALSAAELVGWKDYLTEKANLENRLIFGSYPAVVTDLAEAKTTLDEITQDSLYRDILSLGNIIKTDYLKKILQALALQVGSQVNYNELAGLVGLDRKTIEKYIALLEQSFVIFRLPSFSRNLRDELKRSQKIYFYDVGIRNSLVNDYRPSDLRQDAGGVFENYVASELLKIYPKENLYFWRNFDQKEVDFILERDGELSLFEIKKNPKKEPKMPKVFEKAYHPASFKVINSDNYLKLLSGLGE